MTLPADVLTNVMGFIVGHDYWTRERYALCCASRLLRATYEAISERQTILTVKRVIPSRLPPTLRKLVFLDPIRHGLSDLEFARGRREVLVYLVRPIRATLLPFPATLRELHLKDVGLRSADILALAELPMLEHLRLFGCVCVSCADCHYAMRIRCLLRPLVKIKHLAVLECNQFWASGEEPCRSDTPVRGDVLEISYYATFHLFQRELISYREVRYHTKETHMPADIEQMRVWCGAETFTIVP